jgi:hypothetical protein
VVFLELHCETTVVIHHTYIDFCISVTFYALLNNERHWLVLNVQYSKFLEVCVVFKLQINVKEHKSFLYVYEY